MEKRRRALCRVRKCTWVGTEMAFGGTGLAAVERRQSGARLCRPFNFKIRRLSFIL